MSNYSQALKQLEVIKHNQPEVKGSAVDEEHKQAENAGFDDNDELYN